MSSAARARKMTIYIAASWKHQHAVEMLTEHLRNRSFEVLSFVENNHDENPDHKTDGKKPIPFEEWIWSASGQNSFDYDTNGARYADLVIYIGPSGKDAAAEVGMAWSSGKKIFGLWGKGEDFGLMRRMIDWKYNYRDLLYSIDEYATKFVTAGGFGKVTK